MPEEPVAEVALTPEQRRKLLRKLAALVVLTGAVEALLFGFATAIAHDHQVSVWGPWLAANGFMACMGLIIWAVITLVDA